MRGKLCSRHGNPRLNAPFRGALRHSVAAHLAARVLRHQNKLDVNVFTTKIHTNKPFADVNYRNKIP